MPQLDLDDVVLVARLARDHERLGELQRRDPGGHLHRGYTRRPAPVAQGIERAPPERKVAGSIPARRMLFPSPASTSAAADKAAQTPEGLLRGHALTRSFPAPLGDAPRRPAGCTGRSRHGAGSSPSQLPTTTSIRYSSKRLALKRHQGRRPRRSEAHICGAGVPAHGGRRSWNDAASRSAALQIELAVGLDRRRHGQGRRRIARSLPAVPLREARLGAVAPGDHERLDPPLVLRPRPEKPGSLRRARAICGSCPRRCPHRGCARSSGSWPRRVCAVDDREHTRPHVRRRRSPPPGAQAPSAT